MKEGTNHVACFGLLIAQVLQIGEIHHLLYLSFILRYYTIGIRCDVMVSRTRMRIRSTKGTTSRRDNQCTFTDSVCRLLSCRSARTNAPPPTSDPHLLPKDRNLLLCWGWQLTCNHDWCIHHTKAKLLRLIEKYAAMLLPRTTALGVLITANTFEHGIPADWGYKQLHVRFRKLTVKLTVKECIEISELFGETVASSPPCTKTPGLLSENRGTLWFLQLQRLRHVQKIQSGVVKNLLTREYRTENLPASWSDTEFSWGLPLWLFGHAWTHAGPSVQNYSFSGPHLESTSVTFWWE